MDMRCGNIHNIPREHTSSQHRALQAIGLCVRQSSSARDYVRHATVARTLSSDSEFACFCLSPPPSSFLPLPPSLPPSLHPSLPSNVFEETLTMYRILVRKKMMRILVDNCLAMATSLTELSADASLMLL